MIFINLEKAKIITKNNVRSERKTLLEDLDVEALKNLNNPDKLLEIEKQKEILRDITGKIDDIETISELKLVNINYLLNAEGGFDD